MFRMIQIQLGLLLLIGLAPNWQQCSVFAETPPDLEEVAAKGRQTVARLATQPAGWRLRFEVPGPVDIVLEVVQAAEMRRTAISFQAGERTQPFAEIIERDGLWYVRSAEGNFKYRPYEAPLSVPSLYIFLPHREPSVLIEGDKSLGRFVRLNDVVATYSIPLPEAKREALQAARRDLQRAKVAGAVEDPRAQQNLADIDQLLETGREVQIDTQTAIFVAGGTPRYQFYLEEFQWFEKLAASTFAIDDTQWTDRSGSLLRSGDTGSDIVISHQPRWKPGQEAGDMDVLLLNLRSGETRRLPYALGEVASGCFSADRQRCYIAGSVPVEGTIGIFEIDLMTGNHRRLGGAELQTGITMFPTLAPNGRRLAVLRQEPTAGPLKSRVHIVDIPTGKSLPIGEAHDLAHLSWLPDGRGIILVSREMVALDQPSVSTICRLGADGTLTPLRKGDSPIVLGSKKRILFQDEDDLWKTCELDGGDVRIVGNGLPQHGFPAPSPDDKRAIFMKFGEAAGPRPHLVNLETGQSQPLDIGPGLWAKPVWK